MNRARWAVARLYATPSAKVHPHYQDALDMLAYCTATSDRWYNAERVL